LPTSNQSKVYNDHNVYILGAGFAADAGMPLVADFLNRTRDAAAWLEEIGDREVELQAIARVLNFRRSAAAAAHRVPINVENIEELFSLASASGDRDLARALPLAIATTLDYAQHAAVGSGQHSMQRIRIGVREGLDRWGPPKSFENAADSINSTRPEVQYLCNPYDVYLGIMAGYFQLDRDHCPIITFNYDLIVERALSNLGIEFTYAIPDDVAVYVDEPFKTLTVRRPRRNAVPVLKLHGSVNWASARDNADRLLQLGDRFDTMKEGGPTPDAFAPLLLGQRREELLQKDYVLIFGDYDRRNTNPLLVPPSWQKVLTGGLSKVWDWAVGELRSATRVILLGYSIPATDQHFKYLLAAGLQDNISLRKIFVVNPALQHDEGRAMLEARLFGPAGLLRPEHRSQGIVDLCKADTSSWFTNSWQDPIQHEQHSHRTQFGRPLNSSKYTSTNAPFLMYPPGSSFPMWR
jgi:hypothetical protein